MQEGLQTIDVDGTVLQLLVTWKRVKNVNARLKGSTLMVSAPMSVSPHRLAEIIPDLARRLLRRSRSRELNIDGEAEAIARKIASRFPKPPEIREVRWVTTQRARWGSYSARTGTIRLNASLRQMPTWVLESVVAHELAHVFHLDHSKAFYELLNSVDPRAGQAHSFLEGVAWLASSWEDLPPVERAQLMKRG